MFEWLDMMGTYEQRNVANFKNDIFEIDTSYVTDRRDPYETAIKHKNFNGGDWIILGWRKTKAEAQMYHDYMVKKFTDDMDKITVITDAWEDTDYTWEDN